MGSLQYVRYYSQPRFPVYVWRWPERIPVKLVFNEQISDFREAYAKTRYLRQMNRKLRKKLIETKKWPLGGPWKEYIKKLAQNQQ